MRCRWSRGSFGCRWCASYPSTRSESPAPPCRFKSRCRLTTTTLRSLAVATFQRANGVIVTTVPSQTSAARDRTAAIHRAETPSITRAPCAARAATRKTVEQDSEGCLSTPLCFFCPQGSVRRLAVIVVATQLTLNKACGLSSPSPSRTALSSCAEFTNSLNELHPAGSEATRPGPHP